MTSRIIKLTANLLCAIIAIQGLFFLPVRADTSETFTGSGISVTFVKDSSWGSSTQATVTVRNTGTSPVTSWSLELLYSEDVTVTQIWSAVLEDDDGIIISNLSYNGLIYPGEDTTFGIVIESEMAELLPSDCVITVTREDDEPDVTPTPTAEPTPEPSVTDTPVPTEEPDYETDTDGDGLADYLEYIIGTDKTIPDTDSDGLNDFMEYLTGYNPVLADTDGNGIPDGDEDLDGDGLSNLYEISAGLDIVSEDTDGDGLRDGDEINIYGTDPLLADTDGDGVPDGDEVLLGKNPASDTDVSVTVNQTITQEIDNEEDGALTAVTVTMELTGLIDSEVSIRDFYDIDISTTELYGRVGSPVNFECDEEFQSAVITLGYDDSQLGETDENDLGVLLYNEEYGIYEIQDQAVTDTVNNTITLEVSHFSTYVIVDLARWNNPVMPDYSDYIYEIEYTVVLEGDDLVLHGSDYEDSAWELYLNGSDSLKRVLLVNIQTIPESDSRRTYTYRWVVADCTDNDNDGILDFVETQGIQGANHSIYRSNCNTAEDSDTDRDGLSDLEEYGDSFIFYHVSRGGVAVMDLSGDWINGNNTLTSRALNYINIEHTRLALQTLIGESTGSGLIRSDPRNSDSDHDYIVDSSDATPLRKDYSDVNLGGGEFNPYIYDSGYIQVANPPLTLTFGYTSAYGGNQSWFGDSIVDTVGSCTGIRVLLANNGCGIIAANDVLMYLRGGNQTYQFDDYRDSVLTVSDSFVNLPYMNSAILDGQPSYGNFVYWYAYSQGVNSIPGAFSNEGYGCSYEMITSSNSDALLARIENSLTSDIPVILFESDLPGGDGVDMYLGIYNRENYKSLSDFIDSSAIVNYSNSLDLHYVTITGLINDNITNQIWLRVQSWGKIFYINYSEFVEYNANHVTNNGYLYFPEV